MAAYETARLQLIEAFLRDFSKSLNVYSEFLPGKGVGLYSKNDVSTGSTIFEVPRKYILDLQGVYKFAEANGSFAVALKEVSARSGEVELRLLFLLLYYFGASTQTDPTQWDSYFQSLPLTTTLPTEWIEEERNQLQGTSLWEPINAKLQVLKEEWMEWRTLLKQWWNIEPTLQGWTHVDALYRSRALEEPDGSEAIVPVVDICNHSHNSNAKWRFGETSVELVATQHISSKEEILLCYGNTKGAAEYLFSYGFLCPEEHYEDKYSEIKLLIPRDTEDALDVWKRRLFGRPPLLDVVRDASGIYWYAPFLYLASLNAEDFSSFDQDANGNINWTFDGKSPAPSELPILIRKSENAELYTLRACVLVSRILNAFAHTRSECNKIQRTGDCLALWEIEGVLLFEAMKYLDETIHKLSKTEVVQKYLDNATHKAQ
ncbi:lysine methyltransferase Set8 [Schizosaccharomyces japonicus yFS275]|uniref:Lysine methyltransferase Set8 n=1 Tax=Schizosaccharomyces japonicus (strain yFS275 / FY16936) TaxID=402676 RepID=B6K0X4_SCHJY|nr:lysine methyltransferase Set8 [Schizosaccharomyces japonicus yFS275]EEB07595.1 lysine methyltransferase Set8 [Schizosaccharomyces japonicus yFS275]